MVHVTDKEANEVLTLIIRNVVDRPKDPDMLDNFTWLFRYIELLQRERNAALRDVLFLEQFTHHTRQDI